MLSVGVNGKNGWYTCAILLFALLYTLAKFPGLESHSGYFGMAYAVIHPDSFAGDITERFHPAMISLYTLLVKISGDLWLDDRFNIIVYFILTVICFLGIDKIAQLLGVRNPLGRLAVLSVLLVRHMFVDNVAHIIDAVCYRPSTYACPFGIWLGYFLLKGQSKRAVILLSCFLVAVSFKNGWFPFLVAGIFILREYFSMRWSTISKLAAVTMFIIFSGYYIWASSQNKILENALLFDHTMINTEDSEANPFMDGLGPFFYIPFIFVIYFVKFSDTKLNLRIRLICAISLIIYILGGVYYTYTPNPFKIPFFVAMAVSRSTWWTQLLGFTVLSSYLIRSMEGASPRRKLMLMFPFLILYLFPFFEDVSLRHFFEQHTLYCTPGLIKKSMALILSSVSCYVIYHLHTARKFPLLRVDSQQLLKYLLLIPFILTTFSIYAFKTFKRLPYLNYLCQYGVMGDAPGAKWVGVNEFFRKETDKKATVLAFSLVEKNFRIDTSLRIRTGKTMPLANNLITFYFDYKKRLMQDERKKIGTALTESWNKCDIPGIGQALSLLENPDYLVVPSARLCDVSPLSYKPVKGINSFTIFKKVN